MALAQVLPITNTAVGTFTGLPATNSATLDPKGVYFGADAQDYRLICRVNCNQTFRLNVLTTDGTTVAVVKSVASAVVVVDGGAAGYVNAAELDIPYGSNMSVQVWAVGGTAAGIYDWRVYQAGGG